MDEDTKFLVRELYAEINALRVSMQTLTQAMHAYVNIERRTMPSVTEVVSYLCNNVEMVPGHSLQGEPVARIRRR